MNKYRFKGKVITASSRKEAIKIFANKTKIKADTELLHISSPDEITDEIFLEYGQDALRSSELGAFYDMSELDSITKTPTNAIELALNGHDYPNRQDNFRLDREYFFFYRRNGALVSLGKERVLQYIKENLSAEDLYKWLDELDYIWHEDGYWENK